MSDFDPGKIYEEIIKAGDKWVDCEAAAELLEETRKTVLARLAIQSQANSVAGKEQEALAHANYETHVRKMVNAREEANRARVRYDAVRVLGEMRRTAESTRRAEAQIR
jgi:hypothetical protein